MISHLGSAHTAHSSGSSGSLGSKRTLGAGEASLGAVVLRVLSIETVDSVLARHAGNSVVSDDSNGSVGAGRATVLLGGAL